MLVDLSGLVVTVFISLFYEAHLLGQSSTILGDLC